MDERLKGVIANQGARGNAPWLVQDVPQVLLIPSAANNSTVPLGASGVFTGGFEPVGSYLTVIVHVSSDQASNWFAAQVGAASAGPGVQVQWSDDGSTILSSDHFDYGAAVGGSATNPLGSPRSVTLPVKARYVRLVYTNSGAPQSRFALQTYFSRQSLGYTGLGPTEVLLYGSLRSTYQGAVSLSAAGSVTLLQAVAARNSVLWGATLTFSVAGTLLITQLDAGPYNLAANTPMVLAGVSGAPYGITAVNTLVQATTTGTSNLFRMRYNYSYF